MFLCREFVEESDHVVAYCRPTLRSAVQLMVVMAQGSQDIDAFAMRQRFHATCLSNRRPARLNWRIRAETGLVIKQQFALPGTGLLIQLADYPCSLAESFRWMLFFKL